MPNKSERIVDELLPNTKNPKEDLGLSAATESDKNYREIVQVIVDESKTQLQRTNQIKDGLRNSFFKFFRKFIVVEFFVLVLIIFLQAFCSSFYLSDSIILTYITSIFVETLGAIIFMIKFAFNSKQETTILQILNAVVENFQKFNIN